MRRRGVAQLNAVRLGGLACACGNGLYALYVLHRFKDDPAGAPPCAGVDLDGSTSEAHDSQLVADYTTFFGLLILNIAAMFGGESWRSLNFQIAI